MPGRTATFLAGSPLLRSRTQSQPDVVRDSLRVPGINELLTSFDFETVAYAKQPRTSYDYPAYGVDGEFTMRRNRQAFDWVELVARRMGGSPIGGGKPPDTATQILGQKLAFPIIVSPTGSQGLLHPDGDQAMHKGAAAANTLMAVSNNSSFPFDKVAAAAPSPLWVQLYPKQSLDADKHYLDATQAAGAKAVIVTVDQQASSYERNMHDRNLGGPRSRFGNVRPTNPYRVSEARLWYEWKFFDDIRPMVKVPMLAKGILTRRRREALPRTRRRCHLRLEPRRPFARLRPVHARSSARNRRCRRRQSARDLRQRSPPRHGHPESPRARSQRGRARPRSALGTGLIRPARRAARPRNHAGRIRAGHAVQRRAQHRRDRPQTGQDGLAMIPPVAELVNTLEFETAAKQKLDPATFALIAGSDRRPFERITFRPRMMVNTTKLDLRLNLFGSDMLAPIVAGPIAGLNRFYPEGEAAMAKGAIAAKALFVVAEKAEFPASKPDWWYQVSPQPDAARIEKAAAAGCKALCLTLSDTGTDWNSLDTLRRTVRLPIVLKGIMSAGEAKDAASRGVQGIVVSNYTGTSATGLAASMEVLPGIADAVAGRIPILIDGGFRRGTDVMMALALGAKAVLVARPVVWGLAAYGALGVQTVLEMLQTELGRTMAMCGKPDLKSIDRSVVKLHRW